MNTVFLLDSEGFFVIDYLKCGNTMNEQYYASELIQYFVRTRVFTPLSLSLSLSLSLYIYIYIYIGLILSHSVSLS